MKRKPREAVCVDGVFRCTIVEGVFTVVAEDSDPKRAIALAEDKLLRRIREVFSKPFKDNRS